MTPEQLLLFAVATAVSVVVPVVVIVVTTLVLFRRMESPGQVAKRLHSEMNSDE